MKTTAPVAHRFTPSPRLARPLWFGHHLLLLGLAASWHAAFAATTVQIAFQGEGHPNQPLVATVNGVQAYGCTEDDLDLTKCYVHCFTERKTVAVAVGQSIGTSITPDGCGLTTQSSITVTNLDPCYELVTPTGSGQSLILWDDQSFQVRPRLTNEIQFGTKPLPPDGQSRSWAFVAGFSSTGPFTWSLGPSNLGCAIDSGGWITAGTNEGTITVQATDTNGCMISNLLDLAWCSSSSCGTGSCGGGSPAAALGAATVSLNGLSLRVALGAVSAEQDAGYLVVNEAQPSLNNYTPATLRFDYVRPGVSVLRNAGPIRQVLAPDGLADVLAGTGQYTVNFYPSSQVGPLVNGLYAVSNNPVATVTVANPDPTSATSNQVRVTAERDGLTRGYDYLWANGGWELTSGNGLRKEFAATVTNNDGYIVRQEIRNTNGTALRVTTKRYQTFAWGTALVEEVTGTGTAARTNSYTYYANGLPEKVLRANGSWEWTLYDAEGRPFSVYSSWLNQPPCLDRELCRVVDYTYTTNVVSGSSEDGLWEHATPRRVIESIQGTEVARSCAWESAHTEGCKSLPGGASRQTTERNCVLAIRAWRATGSERIVRRTAGVKTTATRTRYGLMRLTRLRAMSEVRSTAASPPGEAGAKPVQNAKHRRNRGAWGGWRRNVRKCVCLNRGDLSWCWKEQGRSQSPHSSRETGNDRGAKGGRKVEA